MTRRRAVIIANRIVWAGCALLTIALIAGGLTWLFANQQHAATHRDRQIDALVTEVHTLTSERQSIQRKLDASLVAQDAMLRLLRANGIPVPTRFVTKVERRVVMRHHVIHSSRPSRHGHSHRKHGASRRPRTAITTATTAPTGPGKSALSPGHRKHRH